MYKDEHISATAKSENIPQTLPKSPCKDTFSKMAGRMCYLTLKKASTLKHRNNLEILFFVTTPRLLELLLKKSAWQKSLFVELYPSKNDSSKIIWLKSLFPKVHNFCKVSTRTKHCIQAAARLSQLGLGLIWDSEGGWAQTSPVQKCSGMDVG